MDIYINNKKQPDYSSLKEGDKVVTFLMRHEATPNIPGIKQITTLSEKETLSNRFESYEGYDYISLLIPDLEDGESEPVHVEAYLDHNHLTLIHDDAHAYEKLVAELEQNHTEYTPAHVLVLFFSYLTRRDGEYLSDIEDSISVLEDELIKSLPDDCVERIRAFRKSLLKAKRYYDGMYDILDDMEENMGGLLDKNDLRHIHIQANRVDRLSAAVMNLREFVNQVSESYQNRLDINLNETMKFFTVITAVFAPLTLITGWYGMNLLMPEYGLELAYPVVIAVSIMIAIICLFLFKKKKWF